MAANFARVKTWSDAETLTASDLNAEFDNVLDNLTNSSGSYLNPWRLGTYRVWEDTTNGCLRAKRGSDPSSMTDGKIIMESD